MSILDGLVRKLLTDVDVLGTFPSANDVVAPLDEHVVVVLADRSKPRQSKNHGSGDKFLRYQLETQRSIQPQVWREQLSSATSLSLQYECCCRGIDCLL